tara:strand:- start:467 stop:649 length:183 start_codon:yes stop_codon:yes gene_type:complete
MESKGLGDTIEKFTRFTGIKSLVDTIVKDEGDCGCSKRKNWLNKQFPYKLKQKQDGSSSR